MDHAQVLFQLIANIEMNGRSAPVDLSQSQTKKFGVRNRGERGSSAFDFLWIWFLFTHPR